MMKISLKSCVLALMLIVLTLTAAAALADGSVSGTVWFDRNADGIMDSSEKGLNGAALTLEMQEEDGSWTAADQAAVDKNGEFAFAHVGDGTWRLKAELPRGYMFTEPGYESVMLPASGTVSCSKPFTADGKKLIMNVGAVNTAGTVQVIVFDDKTANGGRLLSEPLLRNVPVELEYTDGDDTFTIASAETNWEGEIRFTSLSPADYRLKVTLPEPYIPGPMGQKISTFYNCALPSDNQTAYTDYFRLNTRATAGIGIGAVKTGSLTGSVWYDTDANGRKDEGEGGREGIGMVLYSPAYGLTRTAVTDSDGLYRFINLQGGEYTLRVDLGDDIMYALSDTAIAAQDGREAQITVDVVTGETAEANEIGVMPDTGIKLTVYEDVNVNGIRDEGESAVPGIRFSYKADGSAEPVSAVTDEAGRAAFHGVPAGSGTVTCTLDGGWAFTADSGSSLMGAKTAVYVMDAPVSTTWGQSSDHEVGLTRAATVTGMVYEDPTMQGLYTENAAPLAGFTVQVLDQFGTVYDETQTDENGAYLFDKLLAGEYMVRLTYADPYIGCPYTGEADDDHPNQIIRQTMSAGDSVYFALYPQGIAFLDMALYQAGSVSGQVLMDPAYEAFSGGAAGVEGIKVILLDANGDPVSDVLSDITGSDGLFTVKGVIPGDYYLEYALPDDAILTGEAASTRTSLFTVSNGAELELDAIYGVRTVGISGRIHRDDAGVAAKVTLTGSDGAHTAETDADGRYSLRGLMPDRYDVTVEVPEDCIIASAKDDFVEKVLDHVTGGSLTLTAGTGLDEMDVLVSLPARIAGNIYYDANMNGVRDEEETPVGGLQVTVDDGQTAVEYMTDDSGRFQTPLMLPGEYMIRMTLGSDEIIIDQEKGSNGTYTVNADVKGGETFDAVFPVLKYASITGSLWDMGGNDKSLPRVKISLLKDGKPTGTVITTKAGYSFGKLYPGEYSLKAELPEGYLYARAEDAADRTSVILEGVPSSIEVSMGSELEGMDIGIGKMGSIGDFVWLDENSNGLQDIGEPGIPEITVEFYQHDRLIASVKTDVYGCWRLDDLYPGRYEVRVTAPREVRSTIRNEEFPMVNSILPENQDGTIIAEDIYVPSGVVDLNCDLGFVLRNEGIYPAEMDLIPTKDWTPYTQRRR